MSHQRLPPVPSAVTGVLADYMREVTRRLNGEPTLSIFSGTSPESVVTGIPGNVTVNVGVTDTDRFWIMSGTTARAKKTGWEAIGGTDSPGRQHITIFAGDAAAVDTTPPAALREVDNTARNRSAADLTGYSRARLIGQVTTASATTAEIRGQYSIDQGSNWTYLENAGTGPKIGIASTTSTKVSSWVTLQAAAQADVWLRLIHIFGDGAASPAYGNMSLEVE